MAEIGNFKFDLDDFIVEIDGEYMITPPHKINEVVNLYISGQIRKNEINAYLKGDFN